ncbi:tetraspanin-7-like [Argonauta hians]
MSKNRMQSAMVSAPVVTCMKTLLMVFNFMFWITGITILAIGIWTKVQLYLYMELSTLYYKEAPYVLIGVGAVIVLVGSIGCCCTIKGNSCLLYVYSGFLVVVFVVELSTGIAGFIFKNKLEKGFQVGLRTALDNYDDQITDTSSNAIDGLQKNLDCCGINSYKDWLNTKWSEANQNAVPVSCCRNPDKCDNQIPRGNTSDIFEQGCYRKVVDFMNGNLGLIGGVILGISFFQLLGAILACCLAKSLNKAKYEQVA